MKKIKRFLFLIILFLCLSACTQSIKNYEVSIIINDQIETVEVNANTNPFDLLLTPEIDGYLFDGWYLDNEYTIPLTEDYKITQDIKIYAKIIREQCELVFMVDEDVYTRETVNKGEVFNNVPTVSKTGYEFLGWSTKKDNGSIYNFNNSINRSLVFYAQFEVITFTVNYVLNFDIFSSKDDLYKAYFTDFYNFLINETDCDFDRYNISSLDDFLTFCKTWKANGRNEMGGLGDAFGKYYLSIEIGGKLENQPTTHFIGYCYQQGKYIDLIEHLIVFFAYWRTDEGYTGGSSDPNNLGNDFFASAWASFVDTCKFFYFTGSTLNDTYKWFDSDRVKYALDHIPCVFEGLLQTTGDIDNPVILTELTREGYKFLGWFDWQGNPITVVTKTMTVYAEWEQI